MSSTLPNASIFPWWRKEKTLDEVTANIKEAISLHLGGEDLAEWGILPEHSILVNFELPVAYAEP